MHLAKWKGTEQVFVLDRPFTALALIRDEHGDVTIVVLDLNDASEAIEDDSFLKAK